MAFTIHNVSLPVNTPYRAGVLLKGSGYAAISLFLSNAVTGAVVSFHYKSSLSPWIPLAPEHVWVGHMLAAALALAAYVLVRRDGPTWACWAVLVWAAFESIPPLMWDLYAHKSQFPLYIYGLFVAVQGVRGAYGRDRLAEKASAPEELAP